MKWTPQLIDQTLRMGSRNELQTLICEIGERHRFDLVGEVLDAIIERGYEAGVREARQDFLTHAAPLGDRAAMH